MFWSKPPPPPKELGFWEKLFLKKPEPEPEPVGKWAAIVHAFKNTSRYGWIPKSQLNKVVKAGVRDYDKGKNGRNVIRVCQPAIGMNSKSNYPRIVIDTKGFPNKNSLHIPVSSDTVTIASNVQNFFQTLDAYLPYVLILASSYRLVKAYHDEKDVTSEALTMSAEYGGSYIGGLTGSKIGAAIGCGLLGPVGGVVLGVSGGLFGAWKGFTFGHNIVKSGLEQQQNL